MSDDSVLESQAQGQPNSRGPALVEKFVVRLPPGLLKQLRQLSESNHRSMNQQIIALLENHLQSQVEQFASAGEGNSKTRQPTDQALERKLQRLSPDKKAALLQLLG